MRPGGVGMGLKPAMITRTEYPCRHIMFASPQKSSLNKDIPERHEFIPINYFSYFVCHQGLVSNHAMLYYSMQ